MIITLSFNLSIFSNLASFDMSSISDSVQALSIEVEVQPYAISFLTQSLDAPTSSVNHCSNPSSADMISTHKPFANLD